jgi:hypothetical protein
VVLESMSQVQLTSLNPIGSIVKKYYLVVILVLFHYVMSSSSSHEAFFTIAFEGNLSQVTLEALDFKANFC